LAVEVVTEEVWGAAAGVTASSQLQIELIVATIAAVAVAIEIALAFLVQFGGGVASRHGRLMTSSMSGECSGSADSSRPGDLGCVGGREVVDAG